MLSDERKINDCTYVFSAQHLLRCVDAVGVQPQHIFHCKRSSVPLRHSNYGVSKPGCSRVWNPGSYSVSYLCHWGLTNYQCHWGLKLYYAPTIPSVVSLNNTVYRCQAMVKHTVNRLTWVSAMKHKVASSRAVTPTVHKSTALLKWEISITSGPDL